ncbi:anion transporter [Alkalihalobacillus alcalophilus ATCC 27647 = CGMCC 1.3604]|uniref:Sodium-dependent dicarboxylate transporter SdcS n=1 Tax=Alkalihalobacillus alcalophilus ATCC 27647 = CGMCC 1.3604 TaxID=1218173 RepID=J8TMT3_ALKAL|nr:SLC13 family permease [Alkalihalobacillus alcalophilus]AFV25961.1 sodium ion:dicarboxylate/sulfate transporter [Alkalihalobacillus alcalophilus ATCC 27647 = CGMCC 1.3604]KGA97141.1 anion transporter [Alkalihalobacillus alcalophilus ATCC 27647 = CGMCC 1.3604]MED1560587.1 SLC13 family permease [Alkalihalobacillus alcalophilus]THG89062.1 anion transporter [Alkalihalobacillus alcalophilus ATCC 27647 = CGMCC 1.3604]
MKQSFSLAWEKMWQQHNKTKDALNVFAYAKKSSNALKKESSEHEQLKQKEIKPVKPKPDEKKPYTRGQLVGLLLGPLLFLLTLLFFHPEGLSSEGRLILAATLWIATWWITEAIPIPVTSLMPLILLPLTGTMTGPDVASSYGNDIIFLFLGGFFIATAMEKWNLHRRIALFIIAVIGTSTQRILLGFMSATAFLSMWVSNTAAVMMMIPMALAITAQVAATLKGQKDGSDLPKFEKSMLFGVGYAGTIGGFATLIGTPPTIIFAGQVRELFGVEVSFASWMMFATPLMIVILLCTWFYLAKIAFKINLKHLPGGKELIQDERKKLGKISYEEGIVATIFVFAAFMWISKDFFWNGESALILQLPGISDGMIAMMATILLFLIPGKASARILDWADSKDIPWGVLLLFGGGLAIAAGFQSSGLSTWLGEQLTVLDGLHIFIIIAGATLLIMMLTEITSNTATATMIMPILASLAVAINVHPFALMAPCAIAANCAFMLPVGTPPNAIIFGTGKLKIIEMVRTGFALNIFSTILIVLFAYLMLPVVFNIDLNIFPEDFMR